MTDWQTPTAARTDILLAHQTDAVFRIFSWRVDIIHQVQADGADEKGDGHHIRSHAGSVVGDGCRFGLIRDDRFSHHAVGVLSGIHLVQSGAAVLQFRAQFGRSAQ